MDAQVLQNLDSCPSAKNNVSPLIDKSPDGVQQLSPVAFWDHLQALVDFNSTPTPTTTTSATGQKCHRASSAGAGAKTNRSSGVALKALKSAKPNSERKRTKASQVCAALDSSDYWLRFDSDDESLGGTSEPDYPAPSTKHSIISPGPRSAFVWSPGSFKLAFPGPFDGPIDGLIDDCALVRTPSDEKDSRSFNRGDGLTESPAQPQVVDPGSLYSTALRREPPQPRLPTDSYFATMQPLSEPERQWLLAIAMGTGMAPRATKPPAKLSTDVDFDIHKIPTSFSETKSSANEPRRKGSQAKFCQSSRTSRTTPTRKPKDNTQSTERATHNDIERKYRANLNARLSELWEAIPSLRSIPEDGEDDSDSPVMQSTAPKVSKARLHLAQLAPTID